MLLLIDMKILDWKIDNKLKKEIDDHYQSKRSFLVKDSNPEDIINEYTFSFGAKNLDYPTISKVFDFVEKIIGKKIQGVGLEVGSGPGTHTAYLAIREKVEKVYGLEASGNIVKNLMPIIVAHIAYGKESKIIGVVGDFSNIELPDNSLDFVFDFFSLHHTPDLKAVLFEIKRVLKPGGFLFCFDKAREDSLSKKDLDDLLNIEYSDEFKVKMGVPVDVKHTRRMNGENEYRRKDWLAFFEEVGFKDGKHYNLARTKSGNKLTGVIKWIVSKLSYKIQIKITNLFPLKPTNNISSNNRIYTSLINNYQKEISLLVAYK